ncbi:MAG: hypothetical protein QFX33_04605 [Candidatus Nezhaarchaeota archaeon]|nr:hypothetical protein [Candidatus Nezhaarchaeota archaeon]
MSKAPLFAVLAASLLLITALLALDLEVCGVHQQRAPRRPIPRDIAHWFGWLGLALFALSTSYSALKRCSPRSVRTWLLFHCTTGLLSLLLAALHAASWLYVPRPGYFISFFAFLLMIIIVTSGLLGRYVKVKSVKENWRVLHLPLTITFYIALAFHILEKMGVLW